MEHEPQRTVGTPQVLLFKNKTFRTLWFNFRLINNNLDVFKRHHPVQREQILDIYYKSTHRDTPYVYLILDSYGVSNIII